MFFDDSFTSHSVKQIENLRFYTHHIKKPYITLDKNMSHFNFYRKISSKIPLLLQVFSQLQSDFKLFQQIITVLYCFVGPCSSTT